MCIVVDTNTFASVFNTACDRHPDFKPVLDWVTRGRGCVVFGGTKYRTELRNAGRYLRIFRLLKDQRRAYEVDRMLVDVRERELVAMTLGTSCDDQHLIAIFYVSKCLLLCSDDVKSFAFIKDRSLYPKGQRPPRIYSGLANKSLLCDKNIVELRNVIQAPL